MATESIEILIEANDQASAKVERSAQNVEASIKRVKDVGGKAKASTEFIGTLANSLGGTQIGGFAGQLAQLTERITAFSEVSAAGGVGAMAFKAGLVAAAGVVTYNIATEIGEWYFEADKWRQAMEDGEKAAQRAISAMERARSKKFSDDREEFSVISDPMEREAAMNKRAAELEKQAAQMAGDADLVDMRDSLLAEAQSLRDLTSERTKSIEARKEENAAKERSRSFIQGLETEVALLKANKDERLKLTAIINAADEDIGFAESLLREKDALLAKAEAQKLADAEAEQARKKELAEKERIADLQQQEVERLEQRRIELEQGAEAAKAYALEQKGIDSASAKSLAAQEAQLKKIEEAADKQKQLASFQPGTQAVQSRLLTRGPAERGIDKIAAASDKTVTLLDQIKTVLLNPPETGGGPKIVMVGR